MVRVILGVVVLAGAGWALWWLSRPVELPARDGAAGAATANRDGTQGARGEDEGAEPDDEVAARPAPVGRPVQTAPAGGTTARPAPVVNRVPPTPAAARAGGAAAGAPGAAVEVTADGASGMPETGVGPVKAAVRRFRGNLPASGAMPARITVEEVLPAAAIAALGVPPDSRLVELGTWKVDSPKGLDEVLALPDDDSSLFGVTVVTPGGEERRMYLRTLP